MSCIRSSRSCRRSAALAGADGFTLVVNGITVRADLADAGVGEQAIAEWPGDADLLSPTAPDGLSARVTVAVESNPPLLSLFIAGGVRLEATGTSRTALR